MGDRPDPGQTTAPSVPAHGTRARVRASSCAHRTRSGSAPPAPRTPGCVIGGSFVLALGILFATRILPAAMHALRQLRSSHGSDRTAALLVLVTRGLPPEHGDWREAMRNEYSHVRGRGARRRFALGCARAAALIRLRALVGWPAPGTANSRAFVFVGIAAALCLATYGLVHYPGLRSDPTTWASVTVFLASLQATR